MITVILVIHLILAIIMIGMILLQKSEGGAMGGGLTGGASVTGMAQARARVTPLNKATTYVGICFFVTSLALALLARPQDAPTSIFEENNTGDLPSLNLGPEQLPNTDGNVSPETVPSVPVAE